MIRPGYFLKLLVISISLSVLVDISSYPQTVIDPTLTLDAAGIVDHRITSYNVCYTKLLRLHIGGVGRRTA